jgi:chorismate mutase
MKASDKIVEEFDKNAGSDISIMLNPNEVVKRYQRGTGSGNEKSLNELTNNASIDFYKASEQDNSDDEAQKCIDSDGRDCEQFEIVDDSVARIKTNNEIVYEAKRLAEMERVKDLAQKGGLNLETYIDTYYPDLKEIAKNSPNELVAEIGKKWDARREALKKEIQNRIGDRQITETEAAKAASSGTPFANKGQETAVENAKQALNEKKRLAQIVFFNNIISSSLNLQTQSGQSLGRNIQAFDNEVDSAENDVQSGLFDNLRTSLKTTGGSSGGSSQLTGNESVTNIDFLDQFIGIPKDP